MPEDLLVAAGAIVPCACGSKTVDGIPLCRECGEPFSARAVARRAAMSLVQGVSPNPATALLVASGLYEDCPVCGPVELDARGHAKCLKCGEFRDDATLADSLCHHCASCWVDTMLGY